MPTQIACPACRGRLLVPPAVTGCTLTCSLCGSPFTYAGPGAPAAPSAVGWPAPAAPRPPSRQPARRGGALAVLSVGLAVGVASGWVGHSLLGPAAAPAGPAVAVAQGGEPAPAEAPPPEPTPPAPPEKPPRPETPTASAPAPKAPAPPPAGERILDEAKPIAPADFERLRALIKPRPGEASWDEIPWMTNLWEARKKAAAEGKPLFVWSASADPLGCS